MNQPLKQEEQPSLKELEMRYKNLISPKNSDE